MPPDSAKTASGSLILSIDKPAGWTSFDVVAKLRRALRWKKVGHAGTLDPSATGILIILCGTATRRAEEFMDLPKEYLATIRLGVTTTTDDLSGEVIAEHALPDFEETKLLSLLSEFKGEIQQRPPNVSAIKIGGKRAYKTAFEGGTPDLIPRPVMVYSLDVQNIALPDIELTIRCGRGTYIRSIARDLGARLGCGAALAKLSRTAVGAVRIEQALTIDDILRHSTEFSSR